MGAVFADSSVVISNVIVMDDFRFLVISGVNMLGGSGPFDFLSTHYEYAWINTSPRGCPACLLEHIFTKSPEDVYVLAMTA